MVQDPPARFSAELPGIVRRDELPLNWPPVLPNFEAEAAVTVAKLDTAEFSELLSVNEPPPSVPFMCNSRDTPLNDGSVGTGVVPIPLREIAEAGAFDATAN